MQQAHLALLGHTFRAKEAKHLQAMMMWRSKCYWQEFYNHKGGAGERSGVFGHEKGQTGHEWNTERLLMAVAKRKQKERNVWIHMLLDRDARRDKKNWKLEIATESFKSRRHWKENVDLVHG